MTRFTIAAGALALVVLGITAAHGCTGRSGFAAANTVVTRLDFVPLDRPDYKLRWTQQRVRYEDCYHFQPIIELESPASRTFTREFDVMRRSWWSGFPFIDADDMIGSFKVTFQQGATVPSEIRYAAVLPGSGSQAPAGTPDPVFGKFWMGCTRKGAIKANADKDGRSGRFYITRAPLMVPADGIHIGGIGSSPKHRVECVAGLGGGGGPPPAGRRCGNSVCCGYEDPATGLCDGTCAPTRGQCQ